MYDDALERGLVICFAGLGWILLLLALAAWGFPGSAVFWNILAVAFVRDVEPEPIYVALAWVVILIILAQSYFLNRAMKRRQ